jgi:hypothetical protein
MKWKRNIPPIKPTESNETEAAVNRRTAMEAAAE